MNSSLTFIDGTPDYLHIPSAACRIKAAFPNARLIVLLREPVARALSHWNMGVLFGLNKAFPNSVSSVFDWLHWLGLIHVVPMMYVA
jgi:hypothetical protein